MRNCALAIVALSVLGFGQIGCATSQSDRALHDAIVAANGELTDRYNRGDKLGVARMYLDDAVMLGPNGYRIEGREAIDTYWAGPQRQAATAPAANPNDRWTLHVLGVEGPPDMPVQRGRSILEQERDGKRHVSDVQFIVVWRRQTDGSYRIAADAYWGTGEDEE